MPDVKSEAVEKIRAANKGVDMHLNKLRAGDAQADRWYAVATQKAKEADALIAMHNLDWKECVNLALT